MNAAIARLLPRACAKSVADIDTALSVAIFSGLGLLLSVSVLIIDKYTPGEMVLSPTDVPVRSLPTEIARGDLRLVPRAGRGGRPSVNVPRLVDLLRLIRRE
ncbi:hypothetical protein ACVWZK_001928 [Bradyrhizobium sp. GM0.4]